jgi:predicted  nucleic acid-binding Zn-ribbon protein
MTPVQHAQMIAERAVLVPVGAGLLARDNMASTVKGLAAKYRTRTNLQRELKRYERRGATARTAVERRVRRTRTRMEREMRQRRSLVERTMRQNRRRLNRELTSVRRDIEKQSGAVSARVERLVANAQGLLGS